MTAKTATSTTKALHDRLEPHYQSVFSGPRSDDDALRMEYLQMVISGEYGYQRRSLAKMVEETTPNSTQGQTADALYTLRLWFQDPRTAGYQQVQQKMDRAREGCPQVADRLEECMAVLRRYRIQELVEEFQEVAPHYAARHDPEHPVTDSHVDSIVKLLQAFHANDAIDHLLRIYEQHRRAARSQSPTVSTHVSH
jgi:hypothetical protein